MFALRATVLALTLLSAPLALAGDPAGAPEGSVRIAPDRTATVVINAMPLAPYDAARPVHIRVMDNSDDNMAIRDSLAAALTARGVTLAEDAAVDDVMLLDMDSVATTASLRPDPSSGPLSVGGAAGSSDDRDQVDVTLRLFSNVQGSVIGGDRDAPKPSLGGPDLRLDLGLTDPRTGRRVWQGWGTVSAPALGLRGQGLLLTGPLADSLGQSVIKRTETLTLDVPTRP
jgi:hypothetical protein